MYDYIIKNGMIVDGTGNSSYPGDIVIKNGKIEKIVERIEIPNACSTDRIFDAKGAYVTPGFIDIHRHGDWAAFSNLDDECLNRQGITTVVNGNCGLSVAPAGKRFQKEIREFLSSVTGSIPKSEWTKGHELDIDETMSCYMDRLMQIKRSVNTGMLLGNGTMRASVKGYESGELSKDEMVQIHKLIENSLKAGVLGISMGIAYAPEFEYSKEELVKVLSPLENTDIPLIVHIRNEGDGSIQALEEILYVARKLKVPLHISHMKCIGKRNWGKRSKEILELLQKEREKGLKVDFDLYPYEAGSTQLVHVLPPECQKGGTEEIINRLKDKEYRAYLTKILKTPSEEFENIIELVGFENIFAASLHTEKYKKYAGKSILEIAEIFHADPYETLYDILIEEECKVTMIDQIAAKEDIVLFYQNPYSNVISDSIYPEGGKYHPRVVAAFPKFLIDYVRDQPCFSIEEAIHKMTGAPAKVLNIDRGVLQEGAAADITVFQLDNLCVRADYDNPLVCSEGFDMVMTNGVPVLIKDKWTNTGSGVVIKRGKYKKIV